MAITDTYLNKIFSAVDNLDALSLLALAKEANDLSIEERSRQGAILDCVSAHKLLAKVITLRQYHFIAWLSRFPDFDLSCHHLPIIEQIANQYMPLSDTNEEIRLYLLPLLLLHGARPATQDQNPSSSKRFFAPITSTELIKKAHKMFSEAQDDHPKTEAEPITQEIILHIYAKLFRPIKQALIHAHQRNKQLLITSGELHCNPASNLANFILLYIAHDLGIQHLYLEHAAKFDTQIKLMEYAPFAHPFISQADIIRQAHEFNMSIHLIDNHPAKFLPYTEERALARTNTMVEEILHIGQNGLFITGGAHLEHLVLGSGFDEFYQKTFMYPVLTYDEKDSQASLVDTYASLPIDSYGVGVNQFKTGAWISVMFLEKYFSRMTINGTEQTASYRSLHWLQILLSNLIAYDVEPLLPCPIKHFSANKYVLTHYVKTASELNTLSLTPKNHDQSASLCLLLLIAAVSLLTLYTGITKNRVSQKSDYRSPHPG